MKKFSIVFFVSIIIIKSGQPAIAEETVLPSPEKEDLYHDIMITLLLPQIDAQINEHYSERLTIAPTVYWYMVDVAKVERVCGNRSFRFLISLDVTPCNWTTYFSW
ncbi:DUF3888 domain-containing protein [Evansella halocellulosilytica]|uniref:DUF3888 domain-containing protein n=1 Tax=Evansella halocellulosilytica TaxID=2011013 RepID=UPI000BB6C592|nr:DUF3888 domain-containing protein [Evansella halocellulosilytica]